MEISEKIAQTLLQIKAIKLSPANPFTWASGWNSPIYCDNRKTLSYPEARTEIARAFADVVRRDYPEAQVIAGVATGAIACGVLAAQELGLPFIYVRSAPKSHGMANQVEGEYTAGQRVVVIEDLISTGGSSLSAVEAMRAAGLDVQGMVAIFTYGFATATENFEKAGVTLTTLSNYPTLIKMAEQQGYITADQIETLKEWRTNPAQWGK